MNMKNIKWVGNDCYRIFMTVKNNKGETIRRVTTVKGSLFKAELCYRKMLRDNIIRSLLESDGGVK